MCRNIFGEIDWRELELPETGVNGYTTNGYRLQSGGTDTIYTTVLYWSKLTDPPGFESFFMINSNFELENLLVLFKRYNKVNEKDKMELAEQIQNEIDKWGGTQDLASISNRMDEIVVGGVAFRGDDDGGLKDMSLTHSCKGDFGIAFKKIIINHQ